MQNSDQCGTTARIVSPAAPPGPWQSTPVPARGPAHGFCPPHSGRGAGHRVDSDRCLRGVDRHTYPAHGFRGDAVRSLSGRLERLAERTHRDFLSRVADVGHPRFDSSRRRHGMVIGGPAGHPGCRADPKAASVLGPDPRLPRAVPLGTLSPGASPESGEHAGCGGSLLAADRLHLGGGRFPHRGRGHLGA